MRLFPLCIPFNAKHQEKITSTFKGANFHTIYRITKKKKKEHVWEVKFTSQTNSNTRSRHRIKELPTQQPAPSTTSSLSETVCWVHSASIISSSEELQDASRLALLFNQALLQLCTCVTHINLFLPNSEHPECCVQQFSNPCHTPAGDEAGWRDHCMKALYGGAHGPYVGHATCLLLWHKPLKTNVQKLANTALRGI